MQIFRLIEQKMLVVQLNSLVNFNPWKVFEIIRKNTSEMSMFHGVRPMKHVIMDNSFTNQQWNTKFSKIHPHGLWKLHDNIIMEFSQPMKIPWLKLSWSSHSGYYWILYFIVVWQMNCPWLYISWVMPHETLTFHWFFGKFKDFHG